MTQDKSQQRQSTFWFTPDFRMGLHHFRYSKNQFDCLPHLHSDYHILICLNGTMEIIRDTQRITLERGEVHTVNPGEVHQTQMGISDSPSEGITLILDKGALDGVIGKNHLLNHSRFENIIFLGRCFDLNVLRLAKELLDELIERKIGYEVLVQSLFVQILVYLLRNCLEPKADQSRLQLSLQLPSWQMSRALEYMNDHAKSNFSLGELCSEVGSSPSRFIPLFRNSTQLTPHLFFNKLLMLKAQKLLSATNCSIKEVALELGFKRISHFTALFHKMCGMTPAIYQQLPESN